MLLVRQTPHNLPRACLLAILVIIFATDATMGSSFGNLKCFNSRCVLPCQFSLLWSKTGDGQQEKVRTVALRFKRKKKTKKPEAQERYTEKEEDDEGRLFHIARAAVPENIWQQLKGDEFFIPKVISNLAQTGIDICSFFNKQGPSYWKPNTATQHVLTSIMGDTSEKAIRDYLLQHENAVLVWTGRIKEGFHGSQLPCIKTRAIIPMSPKRLAELLMDSTKVLLYNKMSLGRTDIVTLSQGVDSTGILLEGETKIVKNRTKPPLTNGRIMEFHTLMHARKLKHEEGKGYIVVSRAVPNKKGRTDQDNDKIIHSEIILGANLLRCVEGEENKTDFTGVTHVNAPNVPLLLAGKVGIKGAVDFVHDIRSLCYK